MKHFLFIALTIICGLVAKADSFNLGVHGSLGVPLSASWIATGHDLPGKAEYDIKIESKSGANAAGKIAVIYSRPGLPWDKEKAKALLLRIAGRFANVSVEKKAVPKDFSLKSGSGMYCSFTNPELVGKPSSKDKTVSPGVICLSKDVVLVVTIFADDLSGPEFQQLLGAFQSIELKPPSSVY